MCCFPIFKNTYIVPAVTENMNYLVFAILIGSILIGTGIAANSISVNQVQAVPCGEGTPPKECDTIPLDWLNKCDDCPGLNLMDLLQLNPDIEKPPCCDGPPPDHWFVNVNVTRGPASYVMLIEIPRASLENTSASLQNTSAMLQ